MSVTPSPAAASVPNNPALGIAFAVMATLATSTSNMIVHDIGTEVGPFMIAFFRCIFGALFLLPFVAHQIAPLLRSDRKGLHVLRGTLQSVTMVLFFYGISHIPLAKGAAIFFTAPLFSTVLAVFLLGEILRARRITAIALGFAGALIVLRPGAEPIAAGALSLLGAAAIWGTGLVVIKILSRTESSLTITLYMTIVTTPISLIGALFFWATPSFGQLLMLSGVGALTTLGAYLQAQAFRYADLTTLAPASFTPLIWAALTGYLFFSEIPDLWTWVGGAIIFGAVAYITYREHQLGSASKAPITIAP
jgi:drug/metabolite transporter (DMT)-like permease